MDRLEDLEKILSAARDLGKNLQGDLDKIRTDNEKLNAENKSLRAEMTSLKPKVTACLRKWRRLKMLSRICAPPMKLSA